MFHCFRHHRTRFSQTPSNINIANHHAKMLKLPVNGYTLLTHYRHYLTTGTLKIDARGLHERVRNARSHPWPFS